MHPEVACRRLAETQHGIITREQAISCGMSPQAIWRATESGKWQRLFPRVFRVTAAASPWHQQIAAVCAWAGSGSVASHRCAAGLWSLEGFGPGPIEITCPRRLRVIRFDIQTHTARLIAADVARFRSLTVTTPTRTLMDLAGSMPVDELGEVVEDALRRRLTTLERLTRAMERRGTGVRGISRLKSLVTELAGDLGPSGSRFEVLVRRLLVRSGLPRPVAQWAVHHQGRLVGRLDLAYPDFLVAIEAQSFRWHSDSKAWERDHSRWNALSRLGWYVRLVTWREIMDAPDDIVRDVREALAARKLRLPVG